MLKCTKILTYDDTHEKLLPQTKRVHNQPALLFTSVPCLIMFSRRQNVKVFEEDQDGNWGWLCYEHLVSSGKSPNSTYRFTVAHYAVHDAKGLPQVWMPSVLRRVVSATKRAACNGEQSLEWLLPKHRITKLHTGVRPWPASGCLVVSAPSAIMLPNV